MRRLVDRWLSGQAAQPRGLIAPLIGRWLERENAAINAAALAALAPRPHEAVVEVGCGPGWALARLAEEQPSRLAAVDVAPAMVRRAARRTATLRSLHRAGRLMVLSAPAEALPFAAESFDAALAVNAVYFWRPPLAGLRELRRVLRPGGRLVLALETPEALRTLGATATTGFTLAEPSEVGEWCVAAGFAAVTTSTPLGPASVVRLVHASVPRSGHE
jgi:SAM-dependent methyltransferase